MFTTHCDTVKTLSGMLSFVVVHVVTLAVLIQCATLSGAMMTGGWTEPTDVLSDEVVTAFS